MTDSNSRAAFEAALKQFKETVQLGLTNDWSVPREVRGQHADAREAARARLLALYDQAAQSAAAGAPDAAVEGVVSGFYCGRYVCAVEIKPPLPHGTRVRVVRLPSPEADPNG